MGRKVNVFSGATIPQPLVEELPQDAAWDEWSKAVEDHEAKFAPTAPASLSMKLGRETRYDATQPATLEEMDARMALRPSAPAAAPARAPGQVSLDNKPSGPSSMSCSRSTGAVPPACPRRR